MIHHGDVMRLPAAPALAALILAACGGPAADFEDRLPRPAPRAEAEPTEAAAPTLWPEPAPLCAETATVVAHLGAAHGCPDFQLRPVLLTGETSALEALWPAAARWNDLLGWDHFALEGEGRLPLTVEWASDFTQAHYDEHGIGGGAGVGLDAECRLDFAKVILNRRMLGDERWTEIQMHELGHTMNLRHVHIPGHLMTPGVNGCAEPDAATLAFLRDHR